MNSPTAWGPAALLAIVFGLMEVIKYVSRRRSNGNGSNGAYHTGILNGLVGSMIRLDAGCESINVKLDRIIDEFKGSHDAAIRADERAIIFRERMEDHMSKMECVGKKLPKP